MSKVGTLSLIALKFKEYNSFSLRVALTGFFKWILVQQFHGLSTLRGYC